MGSTRDVEHETDRSTESDAATGSDRKGGSARRRIVGSGRRLFRRLNAFLARQSIVPDRPILDNTDFPFLPRLEENWQAVRDELDRLLEMRDELPSFHEISPDQGRISRGDNWKVFVFWGFGKRSGRNCGRCPRTAELLDGVPGIQSAWFSIIAPGYRIPRHRGVTKGILRIHLGLKVPRDRERCWMEVGRERVTWRDGECIVFDDTFKHSVVNDTVEERVVLIVDFDRPMRTPGRILHRAMIATLKLSPYFRDARRHQQSWEERFEKSYAALERALN